MYCIGLTRLILPRSSSAAISSGALRTGSSMAAPASFAVRTASSRSSAGVQPPPAAAFVPEPASHSPPSPLQSALESTLESHSALQSVLECALESDDARNPYPGQYLDEWREDLSASSASPEPALPQVREYAHLCWFKCVAWAVRTQRVKEAANWGVCFSVPGSSSSRVAVVGMRRCCWRPRRNVAYARLPRRCVFAQTNHRH
jgi:hypothetical protein